MFRFAMGWNYSARVKGGVFRFAMGWNCSAHVSFRNGRELLRPCFVLLVLDGTLFLCLMSCWWLDSIFFIDRREPITSPCRLRDAIDPIRPRPAAHPAHRDRSEPRRDYPSRSPH